MGADDWELLRDLRLEALRESPKAFLGDPEAEGKWQEADWRRELELHAWFLATAGDKTVGIAKLNHTAPPEDGMHLEAMWVDPHARRGGVGARLVAAVETTAAAMGAQRLRLWVFAGDNPKVPDFYLGLGYAASGRTQRIDVVDRPTVETEFQKTLAMT